MAVSHFEFQHEFRNVAARRFIGERTCGKEEPENEPLFGQNIEVVGQSDRQRKVSPGSNGGSYRG